MTRDEYYPGELDVNMLVVLRDVVVDILDKLVRPYQKGFKDIILEVIVRTEEQLRSLMDIFPARFKRDATEPPVNLGPRCAGGSGNIRSLLETPGSPGDQEPPIEAP